MLNLSKRETIYILGFILTLTIFVDVILYQGFTASDDNYYLSAALKLAQGEPHIFHDMSRSYAAAANRVGIVLPLSIFFKIFGWKPLWASASFIFFHLWLVIQTYFLSAIKHSKSTSLLAALFIALCPSISILSTLVSPDIYAACFSTLSITLWLKYLNLPQSQEKSTSPYFYILLAGVFFGLAITIKTTSLCLLPVVLTGLAWHNRHDLLNFVKFSAFFLIAMLFLPSVGYFYVKSISTASVAHELVFYNSNHAADIFTKLHPFFKPLERFSSLATHFKAEMKLTSILYLCSLVIVLAIGQLRKSSCWLLMLVLWGGLYLIFGTVSLGSYAYLRVLSPRNYIFLLPIFAIFLAQATAFLCNYFTHNFGSNIYYRKIAHTCLALLLISFIVLDIVRLIPL